jgi:hypothetical protein
VAALPGRRPDSERPPWLHLTGGIEVGVVGSLSPDYPSSRGLIVTLHSKGEVLGDEPWLSIQWDGLNRCVHAEWKGFANSVEFRASTMAILEAIRKRSAPALVSDNRRLEGVADQDQLWLRDTWMPLAVDAGVKRIAVVLPHHGLGKVASEDIIGKFGNTVFVTRTFSQVPEALKWAAEA